jgi:hypothetical protein
MTDTITRKLHELGDFANGITPSRLDHRYAITRTDGEAFIEDLTLLAHKVDAVIEAYGELLLAHDVISISDLRDCFKGQVLGALECNAIFAITDGIENLLEAQHEEMAG